MAAMNTLKSVYSHIKDFANNHYMIEEFHLLGSAEDLGYTDFGFRSLALIPSASNISRNLSSPTYSLEFQVVVLDKIESHNAEQMINATEENIFVLGQLQDYLLQVGIDCDMSDAELFTSTGDDYNIASIVSNLTVTLSRKCYQMNINV